LSMTVEIWQEFSCRI